MWKGTYGIFGVGAELGIYKSNGRSFTKKDLKKWGITSTALDLKDNESGKTIVNIKEEQSSFWTTAFKVSKHRNKSKLTALYNITFNTEENAQAFFREMNLPDSIDTAEKYYWNNSINGKEKQNINIELDKDNKSVIIRYGNGDVIK